MDPKNWNGKVILIAEDEEINYIFLKAVFEHTGAHVLWATNGQEAIDMCVRNHIDLVLMDIKMPGVDGNQATTKIKAMNPDIVVIVQTSFNLKEDKERSFEAGCDSFLSKPIKPQNLMATVEKYL